MTIDEFVHLPIGLYALETGDLSLDPINPPHTRMLAALPVLLEAPVFAPPPGDFGLGARVLPDAGERASATTSSSCRRGPRSSRSGCCSGALVALWAGQLYGAASGVVAAFLFAFSPAMLAHGHLVTLDASGALGFTATAWAAWRLIERPTLRAAVVTGAALGIASLLKLSGFVLVAVVFAVVAVRALRERDRSWLHWTGLLAVVTGDGDPRHQRRLWLRGERSRRWLARGSRTAVRSRSCETRRPGCGCRCRSRSSTASTW